MIVRRATTTLQVRTLLDKLGLEHITDGYVSGVWTIYDTDGDGVLDLDEVQDMVEVMMSENKVDYSSGSEESD